MARDYSDEAPISDVERIKPWRIWLALGVVIALAGVALICTVAAGLPGIAVLAVGLLVIAAAYMQRPARQ